MRARGWYTPRITGTYVSGQSGFQVSTLPGLERVSHCPRLLPLPSRPLQAHAAAHLLARCAAERRSDLSEGVRLTEASEAARRAP